MKKLKIITIEKDEKLLRTKSKDLTKEHILSKDFQDFLDQLLYTVKHTKLKNGWEAAGLSAIQVGNPINAFVALDLDANEFVEYINPEVEYIPEKKDIAEEGCLSIPDVTGYVERPKKIRIKYLDRTGKKHKEKYTGWDARIIQHEYDHTQGVLFIDKLVTQ